MGILDTIKNEIFGTQDKINAMSDRELKRHAIKHGGAYEEAYIERKQREKDINKRIRDGR